MRLKPEELRDEPFVITNETGNHDGHRRHLVPDRRIVPPESPMWMTRCGLGWDERRWYHVTFIGGADQLPWCDDCLAVEGLKLVPPSEDLYELAVREWIARHESDGRQGRRSRAFTAADVRNVQFGVDEGFTGSDVTPPDEPAAALYAELRHSDGAWRREWIASPSPVNLVKWCLAIVDELRVVRV